MFTFFTICCYITVYFFQNRRVIARPWRAHIERIELLLVFLGDLRAENIVILGCTMFAWSESARNVAPKGPALRSAAHCGGRPGHGLPFDLQTMTLGALPVRSYTHELCRQMFYGADCVADSASANDGATHEKPLRRPTFTMSRLLNGCSALELSNTEHLGASRADCVPKHARRLQQHSQAVVARRAVLLTGWSE